MIQVLGPATTAITTPIIKLQTPSPNLDAEVVRCLRQWIVEMLEVPHNGMGKPRLAQHPQHPQHLQHLHKGSSLHWSFGLAMTFIGTGKTTIPNGRTSPVKRLFKILTTLVILLATHVTAIEDHTQISVASITASQQGRTFNKPSWLAQTAPSIEKLLSGSTMGKGGSRSHSVNGALVDHGGLI